MIASKATIKVCGLLGNKIITWGHDKSLFNLSYLKVTNALSELLLYFLFYQIYRKNIVHFKLDVNLYIIFLRQMYFNYLTEIFSWDYKKKKKKIYNCSKKQTLKI